MSHDELLGTYMRLGQELAQAYGARHWNEGLIDRLTEQINRVEQSLASGQPVDEQTEDAQLTLPLLAGQSGDFSPSLEG